MTRKARKNEFPGANVEHVIEVEIPQQCDYCGEIAELRPYGRDGAAICFPCGKKNLRETVASMRRRFG